MKRNIFLFIMVMAFHMPIFAARAKYPVFHYVGFSAFGGVSQLRLTQTDIKSEFGGTGGIAFQYKLEQGAFRFVLGVDATYAGSGWLWSATENTAITYPNPFMVHQATYHYINNKHHRIEVGARAMIGASFGPMYVLFGARAGMPVWSRSILTAEVERTIKDPYTIDEYTNMPSHGLISNIEKATGALNLKFNPQAAIEFGVSLDNRRDDIPYNYRNYVYTRGKRIHGEIGLYANCGFINYINVPAGRCIPWDAGLKINVYFPTKNSNYSHSKIRRRYVSTPKINYNRPSIGKVQLATPKSITKEMPKMALQYKDKTIYTGDKIVLNNLYFDSDKAVVRGESKAALNELAKFMKDHPKLTLTLIGHTDNTNTADYNMKLSEDRVKAVKKELVNRGVNPNRITTIGKGQSEPVADNTSESGKQKNRRVEMVFNTAQP